MFWYTRCWVFLFHHIFSYSYILNLLLIIYHLLFVIYHYMIHEYLSSPCWSFIISPPLLWVLPAPPVTFQTTSKLPEVVGNSFIGKSTKIQVLAKALSKLRQERSQNQLGGFGVGMERWMPCWSRKMDGHPSFRSFSTFWLEHPSFFWNSPFCFWGEVGGNFSFLGLL